ncbi:MAG: alpha/beta hydrolase-fold protein [Bacteroidota bacterium]
MKNKFNLTILLLIFPFLQILGQDIAAIEKLEINSKILNQQRTLFVYTPWNYSERDLVSFDVIYVFDVQHREISDLVHSSLSFLMGSKKFIVVGIPSLQYNDTNYYRNDDFLPKPINVKLEDYLTQNPNAENFWKFVDEEVIPLIETKYRTTDRRFAIGHSLSASFVLDKVINEAEVFKGCIAISPNLAYDNYRLANDFIKIDFNKSSEKKFIYISQSNELTTWAKPWGIGYSKIISFLDTIEDFGKYTILTKEFPENEHWNTYLPSLISGLTLLKSFIEENIYTLNGNFQEITFKIIVPDKNDDAYIVGNQLNLGNWEPSKIKLERVSDFEREIKLSVQFPIEFKITRGTWNSVAFTDQTTNDGENIVIYKSINNQINLKVNVWNDRQY